MAGNDVLNCRLDFYQELNTMVLLWIENALKMSSNVHVFKKTVLMSVDAWSEQTTTTLK